jgi:hypothetical protein
MVMIDARHCATKRPSKKLNHKKIGPVRRTALIGKRAVRVEPPPIMRQLEERSEKEAYQRPLEERTEKEAYQRPLEERRENKAPPLEERSANKKVLEDG